MMNLFKMNPDCQFQIHNSKIKTCKIPRLILLSLIGILKCRGSKFANIIWKFLDWLIVRYCANKILKKKIQLKISWFWKFLNKRKFRMFYKILNCSIRRSFCGSRNLKYIPEVKSSKLLNSKFSITLKE